MVLFYIDKTVAVPLKEKNTKHIWRVSRREPRNIDRSKINNKKNDTRKTF